MSDRDDAERIFCEALETPSAQRANFLDLACGENADLRRRVERLLSENDALGSFLDVPIIRLEMPKSSLAIPIRPGTNLGRYSIVERLGGGGMGEVYKAKDEELGRFVALKFLPDDLANDPQALHRLKREARAASSLNHPNICTLYDIGHEGELDFIVMEYLTGETLETRLNKGPLALEQVLDYGSQIAHGLDKAHRNGIIHRDLKPANIMLTRSGAKLLDFGVAKAGTLASLALDPTAAVAASSLTDRGVIVGTFRYMSPEQVQGKELDGRTDLFSLGAVLYEMVTGRKAFDGKTQLNAAASILEKEPESILAIAPMTPASVDHVIRRCLAKDADERWQTARDLASELEWLRKSGEQSASAVHPRSSRKGRWLQWVLCGLMVAGLFAGGLLWQRRSASPQTRYFSAILPFTAHDMAIAPNGHTVAVVGFSESAGTNSLWLYEVGGKEERKLAETEGATFPFWSPDGKALGFFADGKLKKLEIAGGAVQVICDAPAGRGGTWSKDGVIVFSPSGQLGGGLYRVPVAGGAAIRITSPDASRAENSHRWPMFLPDGKHFLYLAANVSGQTTPDAIFAGKLDSNETKFVVKATGNPAYAVQGYLLFCREKTLYRQRFDADKLEASGEAVPLLTDVSYLPRILHNAYAASGTGALVALRGSEASLSKLVWRDRKGEEIATVGDPGVYANIALAPDGKTLALDKTDEENQNTDLWTYDLQRNNAKRLTFNAGINADPVWSHDGKKILFASSRNGLFQLFLKNEDGSDTDILLPLDTSEKGDKYPTAWSPDGKYILYEWTTQATALWTAEMPGLKTNRLFQAPGITKNGQFSPDGKWLAYTSNESGRWEIYITSFPERRGKWQVSNSGGTQPRWRGDGKELFYLAPGGKMTAVQLTAGEHFDSGPPVPLFQAHPREQVAGSELVTYDVARDGQRFLINTQMEKEDALPMMVILNWNAKLER